MAKKRRKATVDEWMGDVRKWAKGHPQVVRMQVCSDAAVGGHHHWFEVCLVDDWLRHERNVLTAGGARRSGNTWLRRYAKELGMKLTPEWE